MINTKDLAELLMKEHPGIPQDDPKIARELVESFFVAIRKKLHRDGVIQFEGVGKLEVKRYSGSGDKKDPKTGKSFKTSSRNVVKFTVSNNLLHLLNIGRPSREKT